MKRYWLISLVLFTVLVGFTGPVGAQGGPPGDHPGHGHWGSPPAGPMGGGFDFQRLLHMLRMANDLDVTDEQIGQIESILENARPQFQALGEQLHTQREAWREANDPAVFEEAAARQFVEVQSALHTDLMLLGMQTRAEVLSVLTPEQREALEQIRTDRRGNCGEDGPRQGPRGKRHR